MTAITVTYAERAVPLPLDHWPLRLFVDGRPRTKGSLKHIGGGRMVEQVKSSSSWRHRVAERAAIELRQESSPDGLLRHWLPYPGPVAITARFWLPRPVGRREEYPTAITDGDLDKLERNIGDALVDAGVIADDSLIVDWITGKRWCVAPARPGCDLTVSGVIVP